MEKVDIKVLMDNKTIGVSCDNGEWQLYPISDGLIWLVQALEKPENYKLWVKNTRVQNKQ